MPPTAPVREADARPAVEAAAVPWWRVRKRRRETRDTSTFELTPPDGAAVAFGAGQFNMLYCFGVGEVPISISGDPNDSRRLVHTVRAVGAVSQALCRLSPGDPVGVRGPFGQGWPVEAAAGGDLLIVAGGIGLAPLRPVVYEALATRGRFERVAVLYGARTPSDLLYRRELEIWRGRLDLDVEVTVDHAPDSWRGDVGVVTRLIQRGRFDPARTTAFICGPEVMMRFAVRELEAYGVPPVRLYLSIERNMKCGVGLCGHCQLGPVFVCTDGPVFRWDRVQPLLAIPEL